MQVNYFTPIHILRNLQSQLADANGHFALVASMVSIILGGIDMAPYIASKHAINGYLCSARQ